MKQYLKLLPYLSALVMFSGAVAGSYDDFFRAVRVDNASTVTALLARGFDPNAPDENGQIGLFLALRDGSPKVLAALLAHPGIKPDAANGSDETPLMMAALRGNLEGMRQLLARGAAVNRPGWTPLHYAATGPEAQAVALLLEQGAEVDAPSPNRTTPLMMACRYGTDAAAELLLARGASLRLRNDRDMTAADFARSVGRTALAARLDALAR
jgi:ankyrin repeat protein